MINFLYKDWSDIELIRFIVLAMVFATAAYSGLEFWAISAMTLAACALVYIEFRALLKKKLTKTQGIFSLVTAIFGTVFYFTAFTWLGVLVSRELERTTPEELRLFFFNNIVSTGTKTVEAFSSCWNMKSLAPLFETAYPMSAMILICFLIRIVWMMGTDLKIKTAPRKRKAPSKTPRAEPQPA